MKIAYLPPKAMIVYNKVITSYIEYDEVIELICEVEYL